MIFTPFQCFTCFTLFLVIKLKMGGSTIINFGLFLSLLLVVGCLEESVERLNDR